MQIYRASWRSTIAFAVLLSVVGTAFFGLGLFMAPAYAVGIAVLVVLSALRLHYMYIAFTQDTFIYQGWFRRFEFRYSEIRSVRQPANGPWPRNRWYAPAVYEICSDTSSARVNLLWFGSDACRRFYNEIAHRKRWQRLIQK
jgi:hypothetical protein